MQGIVRHAYFSPPRILREAGCRGDIPVLHLASSFSFSQSELCGKRRHTRKTQLVIQTHGHQNKAHSLSHPGSVASPLLFFLQRRRPCGYSLEEDDSSLFIPVLPKAQHLYCWGVLLRNSPLDPAQDKTLFKITLL